MNESESIRNILIYKLSMCMHLIRYNVSDHDDDEFYL